METKFEKDLDKVLNLHTDMLMMPEHKLKETFPKYSKAKEKFVEKYNTEK